MKLQLNQLSLVNFRNYERATFELGLRTAIIGRNAAGKTNLLEALYLLATTKSFRADREVEMVRWGETAGRVAVLAARRAGVSEAVAELRPGGRGVQKSFLIDGTKRQSKEMSQLLPMTLFAANDIRLIDGSPGRRRRMLDLTIRQGSPAYHQALNQFGRALASRNRVLEQIIRGEATTAELDAWDSQLIPSGQAIIDDRIRLTDFLNRHLTEYYTGLAGEAATPKPGLAIAYRPSAEDFAETLAGRRDADLAVGTTTVGPHRDDWTLLLGNRPLVSFGSGGEYRSAILSLRLAEVAWLEETVGTRPALLLDDVFSELDERRRPALLASLPDAQTIITTPEEDVLPKAFIEQAHIVPITEESRRHV